jgi:Flp pilus assembly protein TadG
MNGGRPEPPTATGIRRAPPQRRAPPGDRGQASVELALAFPALVVMLLAIVQVTLVVRDQVAVIHAAREGARAAAVTGAGVPDGVTAARAATALESARLTVQVVKGTQVRATARYRSPTQVPIVGRFLGDVTVQATAVMQPEP